MKLNICPRLWFFLCQQKYKFDEVSKNATVFLFLFFFYSSIIGWQKGYDKDTKGQTQFGGEMNRFWQFFFCHSVIQVLSVSFYFENVVFIVGKYANALANANAWYVLVEERFVFLIHGNRYQIGRSSILWQKVANKKNWASAALSHKIWHLALLRAPYNSQCYFTLRRRHQVSSKIRCDIWRRMARWRRGDGAVIGAVCYQRLAPFLAPFLSVSVT